MLLCGLYLIAISLVNGQPNLANCGVLYECDYCGLAYECVDRQIITPNVVIGDAYKSISGSTTSITSSATQCRAAFSCSGASLINSTSIFCEGGSSCTNVTQSTAQSISCQGSNACSFSKLSAYNLSCSGDQSCANSIIEVNILYATGAYSLIHSAINTPGDGSLVDIHLTGYHAGYATNITCHTPDICSVTCYVNSCYLTYLECISSQCTVHLNSNSTVAPITNYQSSPTLFNLSYDSQSMTNNYEQNCNNEANSFLNDDMYDVLNSPNFPMILFGVSVTGSICCRQSGSYSCYVMSALYIAGTADDAVICSASYGCHDSELGNLNGSVFCDAFYSCYSVSIIRANNVYCFAFQSCMFIDIVNINNVFCSGDLSCQYATITSQGRNINVYVLGESAGKSMVVNCDYGDDCLVICGGYNSCLGATLWCTGNCVIECDQDTGCPAIYSNHPTVAPTVDPSESPTFLPSISPTGGPTETTLNPTYTPTFNPITAIPTTYRQSASPSQHVQNPTYGADKPTNPAYTGFISTKSGDAATDNSVSIFGISFSIIVWILIGVSTVVLCSVIVLIFIILKKQKQNAAENKTIFIRNPMVLLIGIGDYDENPQQPDINGQVKDLAVDIDIENLLLLFRDTLQYKTFPKYGKYPNIHWTQEKLITFFQEKAQLLADNVITNKNKYDALFIGITAHGINNSILTSDYKFVDKNAIHRIFSSYYPQSREIPRIMLYDCCEGSAEMTKSIKKNLAFTDIGKQFGMDDIPIPVIQNEDSYSGQQPQPLWQRYTKNPDHQLVLIHAANVGFQSKMNSLDGSYLVNKFVVKTIEGLKRDSNMQPFLHQTFDEIQHELGKRTQLPTCTYNNNTMYIKFIKNEELESKIDDDKESYVDVKMEQKEEFEEASEEIIIYINEMKNEDDIDEKNDKEQSLNNDEVVKGINKTATKANDNVSSSFAVKADKILEHDANEKNRSLGTSADVPATKTVTTIAGEMHSLFSM